jgi:AcrR family transcriptional regulator
MSPAPTTPERPSYHHGNLRRGLLDAALALLAETRQWDFSLREVARRAGVSHNAPYAHFADKQELLAAVAEQGFDSLRRRMNDACVGATDAADAMIAIGTAYVAFGLENPAHYRLMFGSVFSSKAESPAGLQQADAAARSVINNVVREGVKTGRFAVAEPDLEMAVMAAWSLVHGLTMLTLDGLATHAAEPENHALLADRITRTFLAGLLVRQ